MHEIQEIGADALERLVTIRNGVRPDDPVSTADYVDWRRQAEEMTWLVATAGESDIGAGVALTGWHSPAAVGRMAIFVPAAERGNGVGSALLDELSRWLRARGCGEATADVREDDAESLAWALRRGFAESGRTSVLVLELDTADVDAAAPPDGIEIVTWAERRELAQGMFRVYCESVPDIPGDDEEAVLGFDDWLRNDMQGLSDRPEATFVALADDEVVGYAKLSISAGGGDVAWHDLTGVLRAWRGRGIAGALKRTQIAWAKDNGFRFLKTHNEERNEPVQRLNRRHGYRREPGLVTVRGPLSGTVSSE